jgi:hypothetical protein
LVANANPRFRQTGQGFGSTMGYACWTNATPNYPSASDRHSVRADGCVLLESMLEGHFAGAKAQSHFELGSARLKSCPDTERSRIAAAKSLSGMFNSAP